MNVKMAGGLCGGRTEATALYATGSETHHIKHIDNVRVNIFLFCLFYFFIYSFKI